MFYFTITKSLLTITMRHFLLLLAFCSLSSCDDDLRLEEGPVCNSVTVDFFTSHPRLVVTPAVFDTLYEQVLFKDAYNKGGATFETVTEQVLTKDRHTRISIMDQDSIEVVLDAKQEITGFVPCISFQEFPYALEIPAHYNTYTRQRLVTNGNGEYVEAQYNTRSYLLLKEDASVTEIEGVVSRSTVTETFTIPSGTSFESYLSMETAELSNDCLSSDHYRVR